MATFTPLVLGEACRIGTLFGLDITAVRGIPAGSVNSNYELTLQSGERVFLRIYEEQSAETARGEAHLLEHLAAHGVPTPRPLARVDGEGFLAEHAEKPVALFPWVSGESLCQARVTPEAVQQVGAALARVHLAGASFEGAPSGRFGPAELQKRLDEIRDAKLPPKLALDIERLGLRLERFRDRAPFPLGIAHGDLFRDNVLFDGPKISALLDFESASREGLMFDLMVTLLAWCFSDLLEPALARALVAGYSSLRPISPDERAQLYDEGCFAAIRFAITRITDFELRPPGSGEYRSYRRFMLRLRAIETMGRTDLPMFLGL